MKIKLAGQFLDGKIAPPIEVSARKAFDMYGLEFYTHKSIDLWDIFLWRVTEFSTGTRCGHGHTRQEAIRFAKDALLKKGKEAAWAAVKKWRRKNKGVLNEQREG